MKSLRAAMRLWLDDMNLITSGFVVGVAYGGAFGCAAGSFYFVAKLFVVIAERVFG